MMLRCGGWNHQVELLRLFRLGSAWWIHGADGLRGVKPQGWAGNEMESQENMVPDVSGENMRQIYTSSLSFVVVFLSLFVRDFPVRPDDRRGSWQKPQWTKRRSGDAAGFGWHRGWLGKAVLGSQSLDMFRPKVASHHICPIMCIIYLYNLYSNLR